MYSLYQDQGERFIPGQADMQADMDMDMDMESSLYIYWPSGPERFVNQQVFLASKGTSRDI